MAANGEVLGELIKAKENIKRKYSALKQGEADIHLLVSETLSPIIEPLKQNFNKTTFQANNTIEHRKYNSIEDSSKINDWFKSYDIDKTYGPKIRANVNVYGKNDLWQADLVEMIPFSKQNKGFKYILCVIDCFTKLAWATPLKSKSAKEVSSAMSKILLKRASKLLQLDNERNAREPVCALYLAAPPSYHRNCYMLIYLFLWSSVGG
ncbi:hypothetical protein QTP88_015304 [Uroleucon formosanum]